MIALWLLFIASSPSLKDSFFIIEIRQKPLDSAGVKWDPYLASYILRDAEIWVYKGSANQKDLSIKYICDKKNDFVRLNPIFPSYLNKHISITQPVIESRPVIESVRFYIGSNVNELLNHVVSNYIARNKGCDSIKGTPHLEKMQDTTFMLKCFRYYEKVHEIPIHITETKVVDLNEIVSEIKILLNKKLNNKYGRICEWQIYPSGKHILIDCDLPASEKKNVERIVQNTISSVWKSKKIPRKYNWRNYIKYKISWLVRKKITLDVTESTLKYKYTYTSVQKKRGGKKCKELFSVPVKVCFTR